MNVYTNYKFFFDKDWLKRKLWWLTISPFSPRSENSEKSRKNVFLDDIDDLDDIRTVFGTHLSEKSLAGDSTDIEIG